AVFEWCLHNWPRIVANAARNDFVIYSIKEVEGNSGLVESIVEGCSQYYRDSHVLDFIAALVDRLGSLEQQRYTDHLAADSERIEMTITLDSALNMFFLPIPNDDLRSLYISKPGERQILLLDHLDQTASELDIYGHSLIQMPFDQGD